MMGKLLDQIKKHFLYFPLLFVIIVKIPHLSLPYFWDEAWSYFPAAYKMFKAGPGLLPGALLLSEAKGHPLFFFFITSLWMKLVGTSVFGIHILPLIISLGTLVATYLMVKRHVNIKAANIAVLLLSVQSLFLAQATMLLPEMLISLFLVISFDFYLQKKYWFFALFASLMVMTKETAIVFTGGFLFFHFITHIKSEARKRKLISESIILSIPLIVYGVFLFLHKKAFGSFFFEDHIGYIQLNLTNTLIKLKSATGILFTRYGRNLILLAVIASLLFLWLKKKKLENAQLLSLILMQTILFLLFSSLNFYTPRYMLSILVLFMISGGVLLSQIEFRNNLIHTLIIAILVATSTIYSFTKKSNLDSNLGYVETTKIMQQMVQYCEEQKWQDMPVAASFNMIFALRDPSLGYLSGDEGFSNVKDLTHLKEASIFIFDSTSPDALPIIDSIKNENTQETDFQTDHAWGKIYTNLPIHP